MFADVAELLSREARDAVTIRMQAADDKNCSAIMKGVEYPLPWRGEVREWLKRSASKADIPERVSGVQIPPSPPYFLLSI